MLKRRSRAAGLLLAVVLAVVPSGVRSKPLISESQSAAAPDLEVLLDVMGRVAGLYRDYALSFTCLERITDTRYGIQDRVARRTTHRFDYFYVFEVATAPDPAPTDDATVAAGEKVDPPGGAVGHLQDYRTVRGPQEDGSAQRVELGDVGLPAYLERAYSWVFVFQPGLREHFDFALEGRDKIDGQAALVVRFDPRPPYRPGLNDWFGRAWIDADRYQLLRVEAVQSQEALTMVQSGSPIATGTDEDAATRSVRAAEIGVLGEPPPSEGRPEDGQLFAWAQVDFGQDTNGMRFPSRATLIGTAVRLEEMNDESYRDAVAEILRHGIARQRLFRVQHQYSDYRFFSVRTATEIDLALARPQ